MSNELRYLRFLVLCKSCKAGRRMVSRASAIEAIQFVPKFVWSHHSAQGWLTGVPSGTGL